jgi:NhaP-type Na+/H+ or K+/H+ antiporter
MLACALSATDTVAAVSMIKEDHYPKLNSILFGEGVINDAVAIVMLHSVRTIFVEQNINTITLWPSFLVMLNFFYISVLSIFLGISFGLV